MSEKLTCFLPCRAGSERVVKKNIKPFSGYTHGLIQIKLQQLLEAERVDEVVLTSNDEDILAYAESLGERRLRLHHRIEELSSSNTSTDQLVGHAVELITEGHILWTHVTSPFITAKHYDDLIRSYFERCAEGYDSLMTTTEIHGFLWKDGKPLNYDRNMEKWPRTQTMIPVHDINSGAFLAPHDIYCKMRDRIGLRPFLFSMDKITSLDIDWPIDFAIAECLLDKGLTSI